MFAGHVIPRLFKCEHFNHERFNHKMVFSTFMAMHEIPIINELIILQNIFKNYLPKYLEVGLLRSEGFFKLACCLSLRPLNTISNLYYLNGLIVQQGFKNKLVCSYYYPRTRLNSVSCIYNKQRLRYDFEINYSPYNA